MPKRPKQRRRGKNETSRPSWFFIIVLVLGLVFLGMLFARRLATSAPPEPAAPPVTQT